MSDTNPGHGRTVAVISDLIVSVLLLAGGGLIWITVTFPVGSLPVDSVSVTGYQAVPALAALSLASIALAVALTIARPALGLILGMVQALISVVLLVVITTAIVDPARASRGAVAAVSGISDAGQSALAAVHGITVVPTIGLVLAGIQFLIAIGTVITARHWPSTDGRHEVPSPSADGGSATTTWDRLSQGDDPTEQP